MAFGSATAVGEESLRLFADQARQCFPGVPVRWAFTSDRMRTRLAAARKKTDSVKKALCRMAFERYTHVAVQSLHVIPGLEYEALLEEIERARKAGGPAHIAVGHPLLQEEEDLRLACAALLAHLPQGRNKEDAVVYVGHGTRHSGAASYQTLAEHLKQKDPRIFIGTLSGEGSIKNLLPAVVESGAKTVWLLPLLATIGTHAEEDIAGEKEDSWRSIFEAAGFACCPVLKGTVEYTEFARIWLGHLAEALKHFKVEIP